MTSALVVSLVATLISLAALLVSTLLTAQQLKLSRRASQAKTFLDFMESFRAVEFHDDFNYVVHRLNIEHPPTENVGIYDLPMPARAAAINILYFFQNATSFIAFDLTDEKKVLAFLHMRLVVAWDALEPYVLQERSKNADVVGRSMCSRFEKYALKAKAINETEMLKIGFAQIDEPTTRRLIS